MKRFLSILTAIALVLGLSAAPALAVIRPRDEVLFTASDPTTAMAELGASIHMTITDRTGGSVTIDDLRALESAINYLSADLLREAAGRMSDRYDILPEIVFIPFTGQSYVGLTSLVVNDSHAYCTVELVAAPVFGRSGLNEGTMLHELCHLLNFTLLDGHSVNPVGALFLPLNGELSYREDYDGPTSWQSYLASLGNAKDAYFVSDYAMTNLYEDFACIFQAVTQEQELWERRLLQEEFAPLRAKYAAAVSLLERSFANGNASPLGDLLPAQWAIEEWQQAKGLGLVPTQLDYAYDTPITRGEFSLLMVNLLRVLWGGEPAQLLAQRGIDLTVSPFPDTADENAVLLYALGIVEGREDGSFDPDAPIIRQEAAKLLCLTAQAAGVTLPMGDAAAFSDGGAVSSWAADFVGSVYAAGVMNGTGSGAFSPRAAYDRQQSFLTVLRLYSLLAG